MSEPIKKASSLIRRILKENLSFILLLLALWAVIYIVTHFFYGFIVVSGPSMKNTLQDGQVGIIKKYNKEESIKRGDIIVFYSEQLQEYVIKRCVAVSGDTLSMENGILNVNAEAVKEDYIREPMVENNGIEEITLSEDEYFAMGDNRNESLDCRELGPIEKECITGKLVVNLGKYGVTKKRVLIVAGMLFAVLVIGGLFADFRQKEKETDKVLPEKYRNFEIELDSSICTGEKTIGFRNPETKQLELMEMIKSEKDIINYCQKYGRDYKKLVKK